MQGEKVCWRPQHEATIQLWQSYFYAFKMWPVNPAPEADNVVTL